MRLKSAVVLVTAALLVCVDSAATTSSQLDSVIVNNRKDAPSHRFLRSYEIMDEASEERAGFDALKSSASKLFGSSSLKTFLRDKKSGVDVLNSLKLGDDVTAALKNSKLDTLNTYISMFNTKHPDESISLIGTLTARYGDDAVARALVKANKNAAAEPELAKLASEIRSQLLSKWLKDEQSTVDVFKLLKLDEGGYGALVSRKMELLDDYVAKLNTGTDKQRQETILQTLTTGFGGENKLVSIIAAAKPDPATAKKARALEKGLFTKWQDENVDPAGVLKLLKLDDDVENVLKSDNFRTFEKYVTVWNENSLNKRTSVLGTLTSQYGDVNVARALATAKDVRGTERAALKLQNEQFDGWLKSEMSVDDVFKLLRLKEDGFEAIGSRKLETLDGYITLFNREKSGDETLLKALTIGFGTETKLAGILLKAKAHKVYPRMKKNATKLQNLLFKKWLDEGLDSVDSVLTRKYKVAEANVDTATDMQKAVAKQFRKYYENMRSTSN